MDISRHLRVLRRYALVLTRDAERADDLVQDAAMQALEGARTWQDGHDLKKWLLAIVHNVHVSRYRRQRAESQAIAIMTAQTVGMQAPNQADHVALGETIKALMDLPEEQREVLMLVAIDGMSYRDAAECLGIPVGTLMSRLGRARAALRASDAGNAPRLRLVR